MRLLAAVVLLLGVACNGREADHAQGAKLPLSGDEFVSVPADAPDALAAALDEGLATPERKDGVWFVVLRAMDRHPPETKDSEFTVVIGAGVRLPEGAMRIRRKWVASGRIDGNNEQLQNFGLAVAVERDAKWPFSQGVRDAAARLCAALAARVPLHPDCVVAMGEVPYTNASPYAAAEKELAVAARAELPAPSAVAGSITTAAGKTIPISYERRATPNGIAIGMMMRRRFDGEDRGMLFVYPHKYYRRFWMRNCFIPIDVAYVLDGKIDQILAMAPAAGAPPNRIPFYPSESAVQYALEMPSGWFERRGVRKGDRIEVR
ncbi:MAG: DUF192 domain-containing protein [Planctomycetota bacterium]